MIQIHGKLLKILSFERDGDLNEKLQLSLDRRPP